MPCYPEYLKTPERQKIDWQEFLETQPDGLGACEYNDDMSLLACSGEHALEVIYVAVWTGFAHARALGFLCIVSGFLALTQRRFIPAIILLGLLVIHPAWTVSAIHGDCGDAKLGASWLFTGIGIALVGWQLVRREIDRHKVRAMRVAPKLT